MSMDPEELAEVVKLAIETVTDPLHRRITTLEAELTRLKDREEKRLEERLLALERATK